MAEQITVTFTCPKCGLWTPTVATLPDGVNSKRPVTLVEDCAHCDESMEMKFDSVAALRESAARTPTAKLKFVPTDLPPLDVTAPPDWNEYDAYLRERQERLGVPDLDAMEYAEWHEARQAGAVG